MSRRKFLKNLKLLKKEVVMKKGINQLMKDYDQTYAKMRRLDATEGLPKYTIPECHILIFKKQKRLVEYYWGINKEKGIIDLIKVNIVDQD